MANVDRANGFHPYTNFSAGSGNPKVVYLDLSTTNTAVGKYGPVAISSGVVDKWSSGAMCGIAAESKAANSGGKIAVWADPDQLFHAQTDDGTGVLTALAGIGLNATAIAGSVSNGISTSEIDESSGNTTDTLPLKVIGLAEFTSNAYGEFNRLVVKINNHQFASGTGTVGS